MGGERLCDELVPFGVIDSFLEELVRNAILVLLDDMREEFFRFRDRIMGSFRPLNLGRFGLWSWDDLSCLFFLKIRKIFLLIHEPYFILKLGRIET